mgnify:CR=1 FL=1
MSGDKASKTEKATPKKVADARKKGQVAKSQEVAAWTTTLAMTLLLPLTFSSARDHVLRLVAVGYPRVLAGTLEFGAVPILVDIDNRHVGLGVGDQAQGLAQIGGLPTNFQISLSTDPHGQRLAHSGVDGDLLGDGGRLTKAQQKRVCQAVSDRVGEPVSVP